MDALANLEACKSHIEDYLVNEELVPICRKNSICYLDGPIARYLQKIGHEGWLEKDISAGYQVGGVSGAALMSFFREGRVFEGKSGRFSIKVTYGIHSVPMFQAWPVD